MKKIQINAERYFQEKKGSLNKRQEIIKQFVDILNADRIKSGRKPIRASYYAIRMSSMSEDQLRAFYGYCKEAKSFSACWWYMTNPKNY